MLNLNGYEKIFSETYPYKIYILGVSTRDTRPLHPKKYVKKRTTHIYIKTHGETLELTEIVEEGSTIRTRINLNKTNKFKILKDKDATQYANITSYYIPNKNIISFDNIQDDDANISVSEIFNLFIKNEKNSEFIMLNENNLEEVTRQDLVNFIYSNV